jgi:hypothetical protein
MIRGARRLRLLLVGVAAVWCASCERSPGRSPAVASATAPERTPLQTIEQLIAARESGRYQPISDLVVPQHASEVVRTLMAVDEFLQANEVLCDYVRDRFTLGLSESIDQSRWGAHLDVFSRYVELIDQRIDGEVATVAFTVDRRVPIQRARLVWIDDGWRYDPGPGYDPQLPAAFERMARGLRRVLDDLKSGRISAESVRSDPRSLIEEVRVRLLPGVKMLPAPTTQPSDD